MRPLVFILVSCQCISLVKWAVSSSVPRHDYNEVKLFQTPAAYDVESTLMLNDVARTDKEVGYKIKAQLHVYPLWAESHSEFLLKFNLKSPQLHLRGKHINADFRAFSSVWDSYKDSPFYMHWKSGVIQAVYLDQDELADILNYKKALLTLFQFQIIDGQYNETDISGVCDVLYESISSTVFRKIKRSCVPIGDESEQDKKSVEGMVLRRITRYTLGPAPQAALEAIYADELVEVGSPELGVKARSWHQLRLASRAPAASDAASAAASAAASLQAALRALPAGLAPTALQLTGELPPEEDLNLEELVAANAESLQVEEAGAGGTARHAAAALRLLPAFRAASAAELRRLLERDTSHPMLSGLCGMLGLAGTSAAVAAADAVLHLGARDPLRPQARAFLAAFALAPAPAAPAVAAVAALAGHARDPAAATAALLAAAAAARRLGDEDLARSLRDDIARSLAKCKDDTCRTVRLQALGNLGRADSAELLLEHAERGSRAPALAALDALGALPPRALHYARRRRLEPVALLPGRALEVRAAALDLLLRRSAARPLPLVGVALELARRGPAELRRVLWQRLRQLEPEHEELRELMPLFPREVKTWDAQAHAGTSSVLARATGWRAGALRARLESLQVAARGLLRRGAVRLLAGAADALSVEVWTRGLEAVAGTSGPDEALYEGEQEEEEVAGGLELSVAGARLPSIDLFKGQGSLLGHVWAGTGSAPTPLLRALRPLPALEAGVPLAAGVRARAVLRRGAAVALDAHAQVSLWSRSARAGLRLRAGAAGEAALALRPAWGALAARAELRAEPRLSVAADLDFYDAIALCVRVRLSDYDQKKETHLESVQGSRKLRVSRWRNETLRTPGRTLELGRDTSAACRALAAAD